MGAAGSIPEQVHKAAKSGNTDQISLLLTIKDGEPVPDMSVLWAYRAADGTSALMAACKHGSPDGVDRLLALGAPPHGRHDQTGDRALHFAVGSVGSAWGAAEQSRRRCDIVARLLAGGCDATCRNLQGLTALDLARCKGYVNVLRLMEGRLCGWQGEVWLHEPGILGGLVGDYLAPPAQAEGGASG